MKENSRFERTGDPATLTESVTTAEQAAEGCPPDDPYYATIQANLGGVRFTHHRWTAAAGSLAGAAPALWAAVAATRDNDLERAGHLSSLCLVLHTDGERTGSVALLGEAVRTGRQAVDEAPPGGLDRRLGYLSNYGNACQAYAERTGDLAGLQEAVRTVEATPQGHPALPRRWSNLALALRMHFETTDAQASLDAAIEVDGHRRRQRFRRRNRDQHTGLVRARYCPVPANLVQLSSAGGAVMVWWAVVAQPPVLLVPLVPLLTLAVVLGGAVRQHVAEHPKQPLRVVRSPFLHALIFPSPAPHADPDIPPALSRSRSRTGGNDDDHLDLVGSEHRLRGPVVRTAAHPHHDPAPDVRGTGRRRVRRRPAPLPADRPAVPDEPRARHRPCRRPGGRADRALGPGARGAFQLSVVSAGCCRSLRAVPSGSPGSRGPTVPSRGARDR